MLKKLVIKAKQYWLITIIVAIACLGAIYFFGFRGNNYQPEILTVQPADFTQTVSVSGKVVPAESAELGFNQSGKVTAINATVGQKVGAGQIIAQIDSRSAVLDLQNAEVALAKLIKPADKLEVVQAENALALALDTKNKAYSDSFNALDATFLDLPVVMTGLDTLFNNYNVSTYFSNESSLSNTARGYRQTASTAYYRALTAYEKNRADYRGLGLASASSTVQALVSETYQTTKLIAQALKETNTALSFIIDQIDIQNRTAIMTTDIANIDTWSNSVNSQVESLNLIADTINNADREIADKQEALTKLRDGADALDIKTQELVVEQKQTALNDYYVRAPFAGLVTRLDIKVGEQVTAGQAEISMINSGLFQIESFVPEINIAGLAVGNPAEVTLDAYGADTPFLAKIISIDPAETIHDGVSTYKVKLQFSAIDSRIKSGMTANLLITSFEKPNVLAVPAG
ncbi:MAG: HlyD family efflux transporter periplasmic adaptor subunit, partial [Candidatus Paceibacterota bacterium]